VRAAATCAHQSSERGPRAWRNRVWC